MSEPGAVVVRGGRLGSSLVLAAAVLVLVGSLAALWISLGSDGWSAWPGWLWTALTWVVLLPLVLGLLVAVVALGPEVRHPTTVVVSPHGYRRERRGLVEVDLPADALTSLRLLPAARTVLSAPDRDDPSIRGVGRTRLGNRIALRADDATATLTEGRRWRETVDVVRGWARERPELIADAPTRSLLAGSPDSPDPVEESKPGWPVGMVALAVRTGDAWAPFLPDGYGRYSRMFNGRFTAVRAPERGGTAGLVARWFFVGLWTLPFVALVSVLVRLALLAA